MKSLIRGLIVVGLLVVILVGAAGWMVYSFLNTPASDDTSTAVFEVHPKESFKTIAGRLEEQGLIRSARFLELYARFSHVGSKVRVGEYEIRRDARPKDVLAVIESGKSIEYSVSIPEGYNIFEIADVFSKKNIISRDGFLDLVRDPAVVREMINQDAPSLEGYLFPETYSYTKFTTPKQIVKMMVDRFNENWAKIQKIGQLPLSKSDLVTLASIIEKETGAPEERPLIASVFYNRLEKKMRLQTDPTVIYGVWEKTGSWDRNISKKDLTTPSKYNTYTFTGLPYAPIANPGFDALKAAALPATSEYLFFVSKNNGTHIFSKDLKGHVEAIAKFQLDAKAREGHSWRELSKRSASKGEAEPVTDDKSKASPRVSPSALPADKAAKKPETASKVSISPPKKAPAPPLKQ